MNLKNSAKTKQKYELLKTGM